MVRLPDVPAMLRLPRTAPYLLASVAALGVDLAGFVVLVEVLGSAPAAGVLSYSAGIAAHWQLSSRLVWADRVSREPAQRIVQMSLFLLSALIGLALTACVLVLAEWAGWAPLAAKAVAVAVSFCATYLLRAVFVFSDRQRA